MTMDELEQIAKSGLYKAHRIHDELGSRGHEEIATNRFGEMALLLDIQAEEAIIETFQRAQVPMVLITEEHGHIQIGENPKYLGVLDGLDGSNVYKRHQSTRWKIWDDVRPLCEP